MSNFVSPEPERMRRKIEVATKLAGDVLMGRKKPSEAMREYDETAQKIAAERKLDKNIKY
ncbi:hypothetical protein AGMMS50276_06880 [Synergistales bacterium]|nr:hypothetical protein AGMMS50276_06880 [Synergistales bacterium]